MKKHHIGLGLILLAILLAKFFPFNGISLVTLSLIMGLGAMAWIGVTMMMGKLVPNPSGPDFKIWKMLLSAALGFVALIGVVVVGTIDTDKRVKEELKAYGVVADAVVVNKDYITTPGRWGKTYNTYYFTVQFQDQNGTTQEIESEVGELEFRRAGRSLKINYSSRNPNMHKLIFR